MPRSAFALAALVLGVGACEPGTIRVVGGPGGVYRPGQGCTLVENPSCPGPGQPAPQLRFESATDFGIVADPSAGTLSNLRVTCTVSYCGTGALAAHAELSWMSDPEDPQRMATFVHSFDPPVDLMGRTVGFSVHVAEAGGDGSLTVPMHAQVGVIFEYWRWIAWSPVTDGWHRIEGVVSPDNPLSEIDPAVTSIPVSAINIEVYVPAAGASGPTGAWSGEIYLDDVSWR